jgi:glycosyltransferase involved in cell wall biosynthesis
LKAGLLAASSVFALPSLQENFAIAVAEAMHAGLPVIVSSAVNLAPIIAAEDAGLIIKPGDTQELVAALRTVLSDPGVARRYSENALKLAQREFSWAKSAAQTYATYDEVVSLFKD